jgi:hypothetical protein
VRLKEATSAVAKASMAVGIIIPVNPNPKIKVPLALDRLEEKGLLHRLYRECGQATLFHTGGPYRALENSKSSSGGQR